MSYRSNGTDAPKAYAATEVLGQVAHEVMARPEQPVLERHARAHVHLVRLGGARYDELIDTMGHYDGATDQRDLEADVAEELSDARIYGVRFHQQKHGSNDRAMVLLREQLDAELGAAWVTVAQLRARRRYLEADDSRASARVSVTPAEGHLDAFTVRACRECGSPMTLQGPTDWRHADDGSPGAARCRRGPARTLVLSLSPEFADGTSRAVVPASMAAVQGALEVLLEEAKHDPRGLEGTEVTIRLERMSPDELAALPDL